MTRPHISDSERGDLLERARRRCFFFDVDDAGARLCRANMPYGVAKIHWLQTTLGYEPDAAYISTPDSTVTRNLERWASGFGYGGAVEWSGDFVPIELKPNCCGMLAAGLRDLPPEADLDRVLRRLATEPLDVGGPVPALWDLDAGNHFLNVYEVSDPSVTGGSPLLAILHASGKELRRANEHGPGLYLGDEETGGSLREISEAVSTPFGPGLMVRGEAAERYRAYARLVEEYARRRRAAYAREIFGPDLEVLFNETHQGLLEPGRMVLGCYSLRGRDLPWVPVTLRADLPAFLVAPGEIYAEATLEGEGMLDRARSEGYLERVRNAALLPHGGGYTYPWAGGAEAEVDDRGPEGPRRFRVKDRSDWFESVRGLDYTYRGDEVIRRIESLGCGRVVAELRLVKELRANADVPG